MAAFPLLIAVSAHTCSTVPFAALLCVLPVCGAAAHILSLWYFTKHSLTSANGRWIDAQSFLMEAVMVDFSWTLSPTMPIVILKIFRYQFRIYKTISYSGNWPVKVKVHSFRCLKGKKKKKKGWILICHVLCIYYSLSFPANDLMFCIACENVKIPVYVFI